MKFKRLLIANRSEIALRIMQTAAKMNLTTIAVYTPEEANALHVERADYSHEISSYLSIEDIIYAALNMKAEAVHPGYGFLAENPEFACRCAEMGLIFVGPTSESIKSMGDKGEAKLLMKTAGVPIIEGFQSSQEPSELLKAAFNIGYPVMIKAVAGGGGRGMRFVESEAGFHHALQAAIAEAKNTFGDGRVLLEKAIINPRHIEIQVMADRFGNVIHLGERDCSVQRRHQKLIEEAPSTAVSPELRETMGAIAVNATKAISYEGAGTFEFLLDEIGAFYFMEMNTRLQVEHPVTEAITGLDLVEMQLKIAMGEPLSLTQDDVKFKGHAIEVRLCAEDPYTSFLPQTGKMEMWQTPANIRVEVGLRSQDIISPRFDSMIAKLIGFGETRDEAIDKLSKALLDAKAFGVKTNQKFLYETLNHSVFKAGMATTSFIGALNKPLCISELKAKAAALFYKASNKGHSFTLPLRIKHEDEVFALNLTYCEGGCRVDNFNFTSKDLNIPHKIVGETLYLLHEAHCYVFTDVSLKPQIKHDDKDQGNAIKAVMSGKVVSIYKQMGDFVEKGEPVITLEAMKMQHHHLAPKSGRVKAIHVTIGAQVTTSKLLAEIEE